MDQRTAGARLLVDINGDGMADYVHKEASGALKWHLAQGRRADLLESITDELGAVRSINYTPLSTAVSSQYSARLSPTFPTKHVAAGVRLVTEQRRRMADQEHVVRYDYQDALFDLARRSWLG